MNPQIEWERMVRAYADQDWIRVEQVASELLYWLERGGSPPSVLTSTPIGILWNWAVARYACEFSLIQAREHQSR